MSNNKKYTTELAVSYADFLRVNNLTEASDKQLGTWADSVANNYQTSTDYEEIKRFFDISDEDMTSVMAKKYNVIQIILKNDVTRKVLLLRLTLTIQDGIIL